MELLIIILSATYLAGALVAVACLAWSNARWETEMPPELSLLSWITVAYIAFLVITSPLGRLYDWLYERFSRDS